MTQRNQTGIPNRLGNAFPVKTAKSSSWQRLESNNRTAKGFTGSAKPFKATGHKGGVSRQGSKRG